MKIILNFAKWKYKASFFIVIFSSCDNGLQAALDCADNNCKELEKVIEYFEDKGDKIALSAAEFIIENMSGHKSMYSCYADYYDEVDSLFSMGLSADDAYGVINKVSDSYGNTIGYDYDSHIISSEYLIKDIEAALSQWKQGQWAIHLDFNEFCEWLLPYTCSSSQPLDNWRADLDPFAKGYIDELYVCDDYTANPRAAICRVNNTHDSILTEMGVVVEAFQLNKRIEWRIREFGPLYVPKTGNQIEITPVNLKTYRKMIHYETGIWSRIKDDVSTLAGEDLKLYQFQTDWHFFGGDNVLNSRDSRYFGLVPEEYIIGVVYTNRLKHI